MTGAHEPGRVPGDAIRRRAAEIDQARRLPDDLARSLVAAGTFRTWIPEVYGGAEAPALDALASIESHAYDDGSVGWCVMIGVTTSLLASFLPEPFAREIYAEPGAVTGGFAAPMGRAVSTPSGGLRVDGRWQWGSGTSHCTWIGGGCLIVDETGATAPRPDGVVAPFVLFRRDEVELLDTWHVMGLAGTGSTDYEVRGVEVPEGRWVQLGTTPAVVDTPHSRLSFFGALAVGVAAVAVGIARRAVDELAELAGGKKPQGSNRTLAERTPTQADLARADATVRSAWAFLVDTVGAAWDTAVAGDPPSVEHQRLLRLAATDAAQRCAGAVRDLHLLAGGAAVYLDNPIQRLFRDSHVATQHAMVAPRTYEPVGRLLLGLETDTRQL